MKLYEIDRHNSCRLQTDEPTFIEIQMWRNHPPKPTSNDEARRLYVTLVVWQLRNFSTFL
ncbi:hypothetical protein DPMN_164384 [Dreissena polymorpha]|uniref:Uncharacterized protein n=1 Tax=Dreissena polymorpha TaxID=45954 RepID=A0A9D4EV16_DREPO|nr:hypothetical protein DPMN_164384 [Dreissena polymorpha]